MVKYVEKPCVIHKRKLLTSFSMYVYDNDVRLWSIVHKLETHSLRQLQFSYREKESQCCQEISTANTDFRKIN